MINIDEKTENQTVNNAKIKEQDVKIDSLQSAVNIINSQITAIQTSISSINSTITDKYNAQTQKLVNDLSTAINALKAELANTVSTSQLTATNADADTMTVNDTLTGSNIISDTLKVLDNAEIAEETVTKSTVSELIADVANLVEATIETLIIDNITTLSVTADNGNIATLAATVADIATLISPLITATKLRSDIITGKDWVTPTGTPDNTQLLKIEIPAYNGIVNFITQDNEIALTMFNNTLISINQNAQYLFNVTFNEAKTVLYFGNTGDSMPFKILYQGSETLVNPVTEIVSRVGVKNNINFKKGVITSENIHSTGGNQIQISLLTVLPASGVSDVIYIVKNDRSYIWDEDTTSFIAMGGDVPAEAKLRADADDALSERITTNATAISANTANIATNTASISTINGTLSGLSSDVATNTANIATNAGNISTNANAINTINGKIPSGATSTNKLATASDVSAERTYADETFQPKLTPGSNISITDNVIACDVSTMNFKGAVETFADLPTENLDVGDVYNITSTNDTYCWNGTQWVGIGTSVDLSGYVSSNEDNSKLWKGTKAEYDSISTKDAKTTYVVTDEDAQELTIPVANVVESGNMNPVTSNAVAGAIEDKTTYSTEETVVGTWIDGKPIYRKVLNIGSQPSANTKMEISISLNIDTPIYATATANYNGVKRTCPHSTDVQCNIVLTQNTIEFNSRSFSYRFTDINVIIEYTKTTD